MSEFGIDKTLLIKTDEAMEISSAATWVGNDKNGLLYFYFLVAEKKYFIYQPEKNMYELIDKEKKYKKDGRQPNSETKFSVRIENDPAEDTVAYIIELCRKILHNKLSTAAKQIYFESLLNKDEIKEGAGT